MGQRTPEPESSSPSTSLRSSSLLRKFDYPLSQELVGSARPTGEGFRLRGTRVDVESLVGWVAGDANHARDAAMALLLNDLADELEAVLAGP